MTEQEFLDEFLAYLAADLATTITPELAAIIGEAVTGVTRDEAIALSQEQGAALVKTITESMRETIKTVIAEGLKNQDGIDGIKRRLREGLPLDGPRVERLEKFKEELLAQGLTPGTPAYDDAVEKKRKQLIDERAKTISRTETAKALEGAEQAVAANRGATHKLWLTVSDGNVSSFCAACEAQGAIPIDEDFVGDYSFAATPTAPGHPNCRCTVTYVTDTGKGEKGRQEKLQKEKMARTAKAKAKDAAE